MGWFTCTWFSSWYKKLKNKEIKKIRKEIIKRKIK